jgi:hypothetical protein
MVCLSRFVKGNEQVYGTTSPEAYQRMQELVSHGYCIDCDHLIKSILLSVLHCT